MSDPFRYQNGELYAEQLPLSEIAAAYETPCYVYSRTAMEKAWRAFNEAFSGRRHLICYAVKANSNIAILNVLARLGSGFDIVSVGELERVLKAGGEAGKVVFSGVAKTEKEMKRALEVKVKCFNVESIGELERLNRVAGEMNLKAPVSLRVNPDVDAKTHPYISTGLKENKFGINFDEAISAYSLGRDMENIELIGVDCHIGSQITELSPFIDALQRVKVLLDQLQDEGIELKHVDVGGGLGIRYDNEDTPSADDYAQAILSVFDDEQYDIVMEPGRSIVGNAGVLLTQVEYLKPTEAHNFAIVDAAMNDLLRPSLYSAYHNILPLKEDSDTESKSYDIVGPVCETGDFLGKERKLAIEQGDILAVLSAGAYGFTMSSNYNSRPRVAEVLVDGDKHYEIRRRESIEELMSEESVISE